MVAGIKKHIRNRKHSALVALALLLFAQIGMVGAAFGQANEASYDGSGNGTFQDGQLTGNAARTNGTAQNYQIPEIPFMHQTNQDVPQNVHGGDGTRGIETNVSDILKRDNPYGAAERIPEQYQPKVFIPHNNVNGNSSQIFDQQMDYMRQTVGEQTSLIVQAAEQQNNLDGTGSPQGAVNGILANSLGSINDTYRGLHQWFNDDWIGNLFQQIGQLIGKWISQLIDGWIADTVQFLAAFLRVFVLNPNVAVNGLNGTESDGISPYIRQGADVMYGIAVDLLLLLFILAIWKYWAEAAWRGAGNLMGAVGRLIFTAGLLLAFPTLYAFEIQITNEMIKAIYFNGADQVAMLDAALASAVRGGILAGIGGLASAFAPLLGAAVGGIAGGLVGEVFAFAGLVIFLILGGILIAELVYLLVLKAIQTALLTAQYMFAPIFLVFFATPDTENVATGFVKAWVETSLWTFVWVGLLKIMVIINFSDYNPWGKILMSVGVLQLMIQVPSFLARAQISPMSDFISAGLITGGLMKMFGWMGATARGRIQQGIGYFANDKLGQQGFKTATQNSVGDIPSKSGPLYDQLKSLRDRVNGPTGKPPGGGPGGTAAPGLKTDRKGNPIDPITGKTLKRDKDGNLVNPDGSPLTPQQRAALGLPTKGLTTPGTPGAGTPGTPGGTPAAGGPATPPPKGGAGGAAATTGTAAGAMAPGGLGGGALKGAGIAAGVGAAAAALGAGRLGEAKNAKDVNDALNAHGLELGNNVNVNDKNLKAFNEAMKNGKDAKEAAKEAFGEGNLQKALAAAGLGAAAAAGATPPAKAGAAGKGKDEEVKVPGADDAATAKGLATKTGVGATTATLTGDPSKKGVATATASAMAGANPGLTPALDKKLNEMQAGNELTEEQSKNLRLALQNKDNKSLADVAKQAGLNPDQTKALAAALGGAAGAGAAAGKATDETVAMSGGDGPPAARGVKTNTSFDAVKDPKTGAPLSAAQALDKMNPALQQMVEKGETSQENVDKFVKAVREGAPIAKAAQDFKVAGAIAAAGLAVGAVGGAAAAAGMTAAMAQQETVGVSGGEHGRSMHTAGGATVAGLGGTQPTAVGATTPGVRDVQMYGNALESMRQTGQLTDKEETSVRAALTRGEGIDKAFADIGKAVPTDLRAMAMAGAAGAAAGAAGAATAHHLQGMEGATANGVAGTGQAVTTQSQATLHTQQPGVGAHHNVQATLDQTGTGGPTTTSVQAQAGQLTPGSAQAAQAAAMGAAVGAALGAGAATHHPNGQPTDAHLANQMYALTPAQRWMANANSTQLDTFDKLKRNGMPDDMAMQIANKVADAETGGSGGGPGGPNTPGGGGGASGAGFAGRPPGGISPEMRGVSHLKNPTIDDLDQSGLWMVAGARGAVADVRALKLQVRTGQGKEGKVWGSTRGGYSRIDMPDDATDAQRASMFAIAGYAQEINNDPAAMDAARSAAVEMGAHRPQGFAQGLMANMNSYFGGTWAQTGLGKAQFQNAMYSAAVAGSQGYITGRGGNSYTEYLRNRYGAFDEQRMDTLTLISSDPEAAESAWNAGITQATDRLIASGTKISAANRGAALNGYTASLRPAAAGSAIRAMVMYGIKDPRMQQFMAETGEDANSTAGGMLLGEILRSMNPEEARAVHEVYMQTGGADLSPHLVGAVSNLAVQNNVPAGVAYRALSSNVGNFAASHLHNPAFRSCTNFDQVRQTCQEVYGNEAGAAVYEDVVRVGYERAQMGLSSVGRSFTDLDVAQAFDDSIQDSGGWAQITDPGNFAARDKGQTKAASFAHALRQFGSHAVTPEAANAVYEVVKSGGSTNGLTAPKITIAQQLIEMGAKSVSNSTIDVKSIVDADGSNNVSLNDIERIASYVDRGKIRTSHAAAALTAISDNIAEPSLDTCEVIASLQSQGAYSAQSARAIVNMVSNGIVNNASTGTTVYTMAARHAGAARGIDPNQAINQVMSQLQSVGITPEDIAQDVQNIKVSGGFEDRQMVDPVVFDAAYQAYNDTMNNPGASSHRLQSIRITERIHGHGAVRDPQILDVYDEMIENGAQPNDLTDDYVGLQRYYAGAAYQEAQRNYGTPMGKSTPPTMDKRTLDRIRSDRSFVLRTARPNSPPVMDKNLYESLWR